MTTVWDPYLAAICDGGDYVVVVVELPQAPEDDPQKRKSCEWKAVGLVTVGVCVW